ncbi:MAG: 50S ribosomal protein L22 [candidate division WOR-3 bacterium]|nr:50S ribosomal protein L22 [candidate division WOR-3 bacterium]
MEAVAIARYQRGSVKKMNRILELIRNKPVKEALSILEFLPKPTKRAILKTLKSAVANALVKAGKAKLSEDDLYVKEAKVDTGPMLKRYRPGPRGSASMIRKRSCHITIKVATKEGE